MTLLFLVLSGFTKSFYLVLVHNKSLWLWLKLWHWLYEFSSIKFCINWVSYLEFENSLLKVNSSFAEKTNIPWHWVQEAKLDKNIQGEEGRLADLTEVSTYGKFRKKPNPLYTCNILFLLKFVSFPFNQCWLLLVTFQWKTEVIINSNLYCLKDHIS